MVDALFVVNVLFEVAVWFVVAVWFIAANTSKAVARVYDLAQPGLPLPKVDLAVQHRCSGSRRSAFFRGITE